MIYLYDSSVGLFHCNSLGGRCQITVHEVHSGKMERFIITSKNKLYPKFVNKNRRFVFEGNIIKGFTHVLRKFKMLDDCPEYLI